MTSIHVSHSKLFAALLHVYIHTYRLRENFSVAYMDGKNKEND